MIIPYSTKLAALAILIVTIALLLTATLVSADQQIDEARYQSVTASRDGIGKVYMGTLYEEIKKWLKYEATEGPIGVTFSAGGDSGSVFLLTYQALKDLGESPSRLKAFTLSIDGGGEDLMQARKFLEALDLSLFLEPIEISSEALDWQRTVEIVEDYKTLDIQ